MRIFFFTGAGISAESGLRTFRASDGLWEEHRIEDVATPEAFAHDPVHVLRFYDERRAQVLKAEPNAAHKAIAALQEHASVAVVTQNVDDLHERAGSRDVIDLHGLIDRVICLDCGALSARSALQGRLEASNPGVTGVIPAGSAELRPDGDADIADPDDFAVPGCEACGGVLKPDVVFFGENVPRERVDAALAALHRADALLVAGSSLMVYSGYRFAQAAAAAGKPIAAINLGRTRADELLALELEQPVGDALQGLAQALEQQPSVPIM